MGLVRKAIMAIGKRRFRKHNSPEMVRVFEEGIPLLLSEHIEVREMIPDMMFIPETISQTIAKIRKHLDDHNYILSGYETYSIAAKVIANVNVDPWATALRIMTNYGKKPLPSS